MYLAVSLVFFILVAISLACFFVYIGDMVFIGHDFATTKKGVNKVAEILKNLGLGSSVFYDFGSARGGMAVGLSKIIPELNITGIDYSKLRTLEAKIWSALNFSQAKFVCRDISVCDISHADVVYIYQNQKNTDALKNKLQKELKTGAAIITNTQSFSGWEPKRIYITHLNKPAYEKLFLYVKE